MTPADTTLMSGQGSGFARDLARDNERRRDFELKARQSICEPLMLARKDSAPSPDTLRRTTINAPDHFDLSTALCASRGWPLPVRI